MRFTWALALCLLSIDLFAEEKHRRDLQLTYDIEELIEAEDNPEFVPRSKREQIDQVAYDKAVAEHKLARQREEDAYEKAREQFVKDRAEFKKKRAKLNYVSRDQFRQHMLEKRKYYAEQNVYREQFIKERESKIVQRSQLQQKSMGRFIASEREKADKP